MNKLFQLTAFVFALTVMANSAQAAILYGNLAAYNNDSGGDTILSPSLTNGKEIGFTTGADPCTLTDVMLRLIIPSSTNNPPSVYLYTGGTVASNPTNSILVTQFVNPSFAAANGTAAAYTFLPTNNVLLAPNTTYWIVVEGVNGTNTVGWTSGNATVAPSGVDGVSYAMLYGNIGSGSGPNTWTTTSAVVNWFQVDGYQSAIVGNLGLYNNDTGTATNMPDQAGGKELGFTTQSSNYYTLSQIILRLNVQSPSGNPPAVYLYSGGSTGSSPTPPTQLVTQLYSTTTFATGIQNYTFTPPTPVLLAPSTAYWVVVESTATGQPDIQWISGNPNVTYTGSDETSFALLFGSFGTAPTAWTSQSTLTNWAEVDGYPTLWRIGTPNLSSSEFGSSTNETVPSTYAIPSGWASSTFNWNQGTGGWPGGLAQTNTAGSTNATGWTSQISYTLGSVPPSGALFTIQAADSYPYVTQLAISSNGIPCGVIQISGAHTISAGQQNYADYFLRPYQIYIPKECLQSGSNTIKIARLGMTYDDTTYLHAAFAIDYMQLDGLATPPAEPLHGKITYMGVDDGVSYYLSVPYTPDPDDIAGGMTYHPAGFPTGTTSEQLLQEWMGVAYCHNPAAASFWNNEYGQQDYVTMGNFLTVLQNLNMTIFAPGLTPEGTGGTGGGTGARTTFSTTGSLQEPFTGTGTLPGAATYSSTGEKGIIDNFFSHWGNVIQYYYLTNEPCQGFSNNDYDYLISVANYIRTTYPNTTLMAPGYAYGGGYGWAKNNMPGENGTAANNWDGGTGIDNNAQGWNGINNRAVLDDICDTWGGHSFGDSYAYDNGSLVETINSHGLNASGTAYGLNLGGTQSAAGTSTYITGGWDRPFFCTECGSSDGSEMNWGNYPYSITMDLNLRANAGFADYFCVADAFGNEGYNLLDGYSWDANNWHARPGGGYLPLTIALATDSGTTITITNGAEAAVGATVSGTGIVSGTKVSGISGNVITLTPPSGTSPFTASGVTLNEVLAVTANGVAMEPNYMEVSPTSTGTGTTVTFNSPQFHVGAVVGGVGFTLANPPGAVYRTVTNISGNTVTFNTSVTSSAGETCIVFDSEPLPSPHPKVSRVQITRRMALAYATHGRPLSYVYGTSGWPLTPPTTSPSPLVYFRAVDTSSLPALPGNTTVQNKLLLSFVNFDDTQGTAGNHTITVSVVMPHVGTYTGIRYGPGDTLAAARSTVSFTTDSNGVLQGLTETLPGGESAEYILSPNPPGAPLGLNVTPGVNDEVVSWDAVTGASTYSVLRATASEGPYTVIQNNDTSTSYTDTTAVAGTTYYYEVSWSDGTTTSVASEPVSTMPTGSGNQSIASSDSPVMPQWMLSSMAGLLVFIAVRQKKTSG